MGSCTRYSPYKTQGSDVLAEGTLQELHAVLRNRASNDDFLKAEASMKLRGEDLRNVPKLRAVILYRSPDAVRLRVRHFAIGLVAEVIVSGDEGYIHDVRGGALYKGTLNELRRQGGMLGSLSLSDMISALLVSDSLSSRLDRGGSFRKLLTEEFLYVTEQDDTGRKTTWKLRRSDALIAEILVTAPSGEQELHFEYDGFRLLGQKPIPRKIYLDVFEGYLNLDLTGITIDPDADVNPANVDYLNPRLPVFPLSALGEDSMLDDLPGE